MVAEWYSEFCEIDNLVFNSFRNFKPVKRLYSHAPLVLDVFFYYINFNFVVGAAMQVIDVNYSYPLALSVSSIGCQCYAFVGYQ